MEHFPELHEPRAAAIDAAAKQAVGMVQRSSEAYSSLGLYGAARVYDAVSMVISLSDEDLLAHADSLDHPDEYNTLGLAEAEIFARNNRTLREQMERHAKSWEMTNRKGDARLHAMWRLRSDVAGRTVRLMYFNGATPEQHQEYRGCAYIVHLANFARSATNLAWERLSLSPPNNQPTS